MGIGILIGFAILLVTEFRQDKKIERNYSAGLRIYCADRKKVIQVCQNPFAKQILMDFGIVTMRVLNSYDRTIL